MRVDGALLESHLNNHGTMDNFVAALIDHLTEVNHRRIVDKPYAEKNAAFEQLSQEADQERSEEELAEFCHNLLKDNISIDEGSSVN